jgi:uncharacterized protein YfiM (DUF2279 family)
MRNSLKILIIVNVLCYLQATMCFSQQYADSLMPVVPVDSTDAHKNSLHKIYQKRKLLTGAVSVVSLGSTFISLNNSWYKQYDKAPFHTFNDAGEWLQMDKMGHAWTAYNSSSLIYEMWRWAGVKRNNAILLGSLTGLGYLTTIEYLDGRSAGWGWSWSDMGANIFGISLFAIQQAAFNNQAVRIKFTAHNEQYPGQFKARVDELFGASFSSRLLKDYNAQTYWLSLNLRSFFPKTKLPEWLNIAIGYGAEGMLGGFNNRVYDDNGILIFDASATKRFRQWYFSPDIDLSKITTRSKFMKSLLNTINIIKIPFPAVEYSNGKFKTHLFYF